MPGPFSTLAGMAKPALGRGLGALLSGGTMAARSTSPAPETTAPAQRPAPPAESNPASDKGEQIRQVRLELVHPCPFQPRKSFPVEALEELADSIKKQGIVQPLICRPSNGGFELIAGERRWRAAQLAGLAEVPIIIRSADDRSVLELALIENLQRENLNPIEEAHGYAQLIEQFNLTQEETASRVGKSRVVVANALRLLKLPAAVQGHVREGRLSVGHAKAILGLGSSTQQEQAASRVVKEALSVRQIEVLVSRLQKEPPADGKPAAGFLKVRDPNVTDLEGKLRERLGTKVGLRYAQGKGSIEISFFSDPELERILQLLGINLEQ
jgi:ParB family transcriptional regulator, chromosome partitioning protein